MSFHFKHGDYAGYKNFGKPIPIITRLPWIVLFPILLFLDLSAKPDSFIIFNGIIAILFILLTFLWRYGDNYRYLVYASPSLCMVFAYLVYPIPEPWNLILISLGILSSLLRLGYYYYKGMSKRLVTSKLLESFDFVRNNTSIDSLGLVPVSYVYPAAYYTGKKVLGTDGSPEPWEKGKDYSRFFITEDGFLEVLEEFNVNTFLVDMNHPDYPIFIQTLKKFKNLSYDRIFSNNNYEIYQCRKKINA